MNINNCDLTTKSIAKQLILFVLPIWLGTFFQQLYNTADAIFVGRFVGKSALAAVGGPCSQIVNLLIGVFVELAAGSSVIIAQFFGANIGKKVGKAIHTALAIAVVSGLLLTAAGFMFTPALLRSMDAHGEIYEIGKKYLNIYFSGTIFITVYNLGASVLRALGDSKHPFYFLMSGCAANIVLDFVLIYWAKMGVEGAALATVGSQVFSAVLIIRELCRLPEEYRLHIKKIRFHFGILKRMLRIGVPEAMQQVLYSFSNILIQAIIDRFGTNTIAAMSAYSKVDALFWMTLESFGIAITSISGQYYGAGKLSAVRKSTRVCLLICVGVSVVLGTFLIGFGEMLFKLFTDDPEVVAIALQIQRFLIPCYLLFIFVIVLAGALRGMGHSFVPMLITFAGICLMRVVWLYGVVPMKPVLMTTIMTYPVTWTMTSIAFIIYYKITMRAETSGKSRTL